MITVPASFREMPRWWHDEAGRGWLDDLPELVAAQCRSWGLVVDGEPMHGSNALVVPVRRGAEQAALRLAPPGDDVAAEVTALRTWDGHGTVQLYDADVAARALLLERLDGTRTLRAEPLGVAIPVLADLVSRLAVPVPSGVRSTQEIAAEGATGWPAEWTALGEPTSPEQLTAAVALARSFAERPAGRSAVNGDLHGDQVLAGQRSPWVVVDPVLLRGDPEYDLARELWFRLDDLRDTQVHAAVEDFARRAGVPLWRTRGWIVLRSMSYLLWGLARGLTFDPPRCRRLLDLYG